MKHTLLAAIALLSCAASTTAGMQSDTGACRVDQSGIDWQLPFRTARARAESEHRLLFVKPIAFGTTADGGW